MTNYDGNQAIIPGFEAYVSEVWRMEMQQRASQPPGSMSPRQDSDTMARQYTNLFQESGKAVLPPPDVPDPRQLFLRFS